MGRNATQIGQRILISAVFLFSLTKVVAGPQPNTAVDSAEPRRLLTGKALRDALDDRRGETSQGISLGQAVRSLQTDTGIAIVLDRRVDPSRLVDASTEYVTTRTSISAFAESATASASFADDFVVIGPVVATTRFRTLAAINRKSILNMRHELDAELYRSLSKSHDWSWPDLAEPRQLIVDAAEGLGTTVDNPEMIPHDLWATVTLPPLAFADFATLVLNQFDLNFQFTAQGTLRIVPGAESVVIEQTHRVPAREKDAVVRRWQKEFPRLIVKWKGGSAMATATVETHERLEQIIRGDSDSQVTAAAIQDRLFTMKAPAGTPIGRVMTTLRKSGINIRIEGRTDEQLAPLLLQTVEFDLVKSPGSEFFPQIFKSWQVDVRVDADSVILTFPTP
ncbi:MAG: hypothetical protein GY903_21410 [Fuerstiella sp.]|nr:hypothetical protein [Fuerstiella sp.]MCP4857050.1 hypothetical protein [Fuerstiella sp.]